jgi:nitrogen fixation protein FixH
MMTREFTGRHMATIMVAFFAVVIGVNFVMAREAVRTFGGTIVDNSYVSSQAFDSWLDAARVQARLGWEMSVELGAGNEFGVRLTAPAGPIDRAQVRAEFEHPLGRAAGRTLTLNPRGDGRYAAVVDLPPGRWRVRIIAAAERHQARFIQDIRL